MTTSDGRDDLVKYINLHLADHHPELNLSQKEIDSMIKEVDVVVVGPKNMGSMQKEETAAARIEDRIGKLTR